MGLEVATFINQLVATNPVGALDPKSQGDDHIKLIKSALQATFPNITGAVTPTHTQINTVIGSGITGFAAAANAVKGSGVAAAGAATTGLRSDVQLLLDLADTYAWTGAHSFSQAVSMTSTLAVTGAITKATKEVPSVADNPAWEDLNTYLAGIDIAGEQSVYGNLVLRMSTDAPFLSFAKSDKSVRYGYIQYDKSNDALLIVNEIAGGPIRLVTNGSSATYDGVEIGYRGMRQQRVINSSANSNASDAGGIIFYTGGSGDTFTANTNPAVNALLTIVNLGGGALTLAASSSLEWWNGTGSVPAGNRTLAIGGMACMLQTSAGAWKVWGFGLT